MSKRNVVNCPHCVENVGLPTKRGTNKGFTLIELLVVILIIGILAAVALPQYQKAVEKTRLSEALVTISNIQKGIDAWLLENGWSAMEIVGCSDTEDGKCNVLDIDVEGALDCSHEDDDSISPCFGKDYIFGAFCESTYCHINVRRWKNDGSSILLQVTKNKEDEKWNYEYGEMDDETGEYLGKVLASQGWREC